MAAPIIVVGHKNPDNDAISAAIGYAWLKNAVEERSVEDPAKRQVYVPARLGPLPPETAGVLKKWGGAKNEFLLVFNPCPLKNIQCF